MPSRQDVDERITDIRVLATVVGGQPAVQADDSPLRL